jgi:hypothetical protein
MPLQYLSSTGELLLSITFINAVIDVLQSLSYFEEELSLLSTYHLAVDPDKFGVLIIDDIFKGDLRDALVRLYKEERDAYDKLKAEFPETEHVRNLDCGTFF